MTSSSSNGIVSNMTSSTVTSPTLQRANDSSNVGFIVTSGPLFDTVHNELMEINIYPFVLVIIYMVVGFIGNSVVIYIFTAKWKLTKTTVFILTLAGVDLMSCVINMPSEAAILWHPIDFDYDVMCRISRYTTFITTAASSFVLIAISIDRYLMVCRPFLGRELGVSYARKTCIVAVCLGLVTTCPSIIFYGTFTSHVELFDSERNATVQVESKTCLISNYYVEHFRLPAGFYFFLFGAHVIMFVILTMLYMLIGRKLFMSANSHLPSEKRHSLKYFGLSMMSAITGTVPNSSCDQKDRMSMGSRSSRAVSLENIHRIDHSPRPFASTTDNAPNSARISSDTAVSIFLNDDDLLSPNNNENPKVEPEAAGRVKNGSVPNDKNPMQDDGNCLAEKAPAVMDNTKPVNKHFLYADPSIPSDDSASESSQTSPLKQRNDLSINILKDRWRPQNGRLSSGSTTSPGPNSPMTPESVRGILYRSQSIESRAKMNRIISDELRKVEVKEFSLRRNTLIMRMVTLAFVISFLPYLVIVTLRYSDPYILTKLSKAEKIVYQVFLRTYFINSMINPFIYGFMNIEFRAKVKELFCAFCTRHNIRLPNRG